MKTNNMDLEITLGFNLDKENNGVRVEMFVPDDQSPLTCLQYIDLLTSTIAKLIKTADKVEYKDYDLMNLVIEHLNSEFVDNEEIKNLFIDEEKMLNSINDNIMLPISNKHIDLVKELLSFGLIAYKNHHTEYKPIPMEIIKFL
jgi:hypothetical protein